MKNIIEKLENMIDKKDILVNEPMKKHTSFRIGGCADYFVNVRNIEQLRQLLELARRENIPFQIIGNGTNLLVREGGMRGIVVKLGLQDYSIERQDEHVLITCGCGMSLGKLALIALENGLTGLEAMAGIPGTVGGAIRMNAGAYGSEMKDVVVCSKAMDRFGKIQEFDLAAHEFAYRKSAFETNEWILLETTIRLKDGDKSQIEEKMQEYKKSRMQKQPLEFPNAGSIFKRNDGMPVAKLIDECGLKGYCVGDAEVSSKHSGFIINRGNATAKDVVALIEHMKAEVKKKFDVDMKLEIIVIGEE